MEPRDLPAVWRIARAQNRRDGTNYPVPPIFDMNEQSARFGQTMPNVILALVTEVNVHPSKQRSLAGDSERWRVRQMHVWLRTVEMMDFGGGREDTEFSIAHMPMVLETLAARGYGDMHCFVPKVRLEELEELLAGQRLCRDDDRLAHFYTAIGQEA